MRVVIKCLFTLAALAALLIIPAFNALPSQADGPHLILFWDGDTIPAGWTCLSDAPGKPFYNRFPRGSGTFGGQGGVVTHSHNWYRIILQGPALPPNLGSPFPGHDAPLAIHNHNVSHSSMGSESNYPAYRSLKVISCDSGIPAVLPAGAVAPFSQPAPAGWTRYSAQDGRMILGSGMVGNGGNDQHRHADINVVLTNASGANKVGGPMKPTTQACHMDHFHSIDDIAYTSWAQNVPPYTTAILAKTDADAAVPAGMLGLFDGTPPLSWVTVSDLYGAFHQRFIRGDTVYAGTGGWGYHTHDDSSGNTKLNTIVPSAVWGVPLDVFSLNPHKHHYTLQWASSDNIPPYTDVIIAAYRPVIPTLVTGDPAAVLDTTATLNGTVNSIGDTSVIERGFEWDTDGASPFSSSWTEIGSFGTGVFNHPVSPLQRGTLYYCRAKAMNQAVASWGFGGLRQFLTRPAVPSGLNIIAGNSQLSLYWTRGEAALRTMVRRSTAGYPANVTDGTQVYFDTGVNFVDTGLTNTVTYYYSAWSEVTVGTLQQFSSTCASAAGTPDNAPDLTTDSATSITGTTGVLNATITNIHGEDVVERGFDWDTDSGEMYTNHWIETGTFGTGPFSHRLTSLTKGQIYYYRGKARHNDAVWGYGQESYFLTRPDPPTSLTAAATLSQVNLAWTKGEGAYLTYIERSSTGFPSNPGDGTLVYCGLDSSCIDTVSLSPCTHYYYSAWCVATGDNQIMFSDGKATVDCIVYGPPTVTTGEATQVTFNSAQLNGSLVSLCFEQQVNISFEYGLSPGAYTSQTPQQIMSLPGSFSCILRGLTPGSTVYFRTRVDNDVTGFGPEKNFQLPMVPSSAAYPSSSGGAVSSPSSPAVPLPNISPQSATLSASKALPGEPVTVSAILCNRGTANGSARVTLTINGREEAAHGITLESGKTRVVVFTVTENEPGTYHMYVNETYAGTLTVEEQANLTTVLLVSLALIFASLVLGLFYLLRRSGHAI